MTSDDACTKTIYAVPCNICGSGYPGCDISRPCI